MSLTPARCARSRRMVQPSVKVSLIKALLISGHPDLEVFRLRLGKALDFDYFEDWQGSLFSRADPRSAGPALDVERVLNKLEKVALRYKRKNGRPLVLAFNGGSGFVASLTQMFICSRTTRTGTPYCISCNKEPKLGLKE